MLHILADSSVPHDYQCEPTILHRDDTHLWHQSSSNLYQRTSICVQSWIQICLSNLKLSMIIRTSHSRFCHSGNFSPVDEIEAIEEKNNTPNIHILIQMTFKCYVFYVVVLVPRMWREIMIWEN